MTRLVVRDGYERTSLSNLLEQARVARATFYRQFADKRDCLVGAQRYCREELMRSIVAAEGSPWAALTTFARERSEQIGLLADLPLPGDQRVLSEHEHARRDIAAAMLASDASLRDLPVALLVGGALRVLAHRAGQPDVDGRAVASDIEAWVNSYSSGATRLAQLCDRAPLPALLALPSPMSTTLEQGYPQNSRLKILRALVDEVDRPDGPSTVGQLASSAGLTREAFYGHFPDRAAATKRVRQIISGDLIALCMRAFVAHQQWPQQVWHTGHVVVSFCDEHPKLTRFLLQSPLQGPHDDLEDCLAPFRLFLAPGLQNLHEKSRDLYGQLILATEIELLFSGIQSSKSLRGELPWLAFLALAPPLGGEAAADLIEAKLKQ